MKNILLPTDFSPLSLAVAKKMSLDPMYKDAKFISLHVLDLSGIYLSYSANMGVPVGLEEQMKQAANDSMKHFIDEILKNSNKTVEGYVQLGEIPDALIEFIQNKNIDLVAIATHGHKGISHFLLGSVTEKLIRSAPCPVLCFHPNTLK